MEFTGKRVYSAALGVKLNISDTLSELMRDSRGKPRRKGPDKGKERASQLIAVPTYPGRSYMRNESSFKVNFRELRSTFLIKHLSASEQSGTLLNCRPEVRNKMPDTRYR